MRSTQVSADDLYGPHTDPWAGHSQAGLSDSGRKPSRPKPRREVA
jgi:hypothetical protein